MSIADIEDEMGYFKRYKKYEKIDAGEKERMLKLVKSGFDPATIEVDSSQDDIEKIEEAKER
jgi:hypothetical protein